MKFLSSAIAILALGAAPALAHFNLNFPTSRGDNHPTQLTAPCGGKNTESTDRTEISPNGFPIAVSTSHSVSGIEVLFCPGNSCTTSDDFNVTLVNTFLENGAGNVCLPSVSFPSTVYHNSTINGTVQVIFFSDDGELYNCADVTVTRGGASSSSTCQNTTGVTFSEWEGSLSSSSSASGSAAATSSTAAAGKLVASTGVVGAILAVLGAAAL
ncbi:hypothetical protein V1514DRAFT_350518 [Lipomyces japonicus]|uniref:uncharacterized protein n=1 Tax=Lipomyces japonicus TaxID=56871 RepID=UPI0034CF7817